MKRIDNKVRDEIIDQLINQIICKYKDPVRGKVIHQIWDIIAERTTRRTFVLETNSKSIYQCD